MTSRAIRLLFALFLSAGALSACGGGEASAPPDGGWECTPSSLCDDGDRCTTMGTCSEDGVCQGGEPLACEPSDACHTSSCVPEVGCVETLIDEDGDGFASEELGFCGLDCDDTDPDRHPDAEEVCDGVDNNCDPTDDEPAVAWQEDCDGDGYGAPSEDSLMRCNGEAPDEPLSCEGEDGAWVVAQDADDCCDFDARYFPGSGAWIDGAAPPCGNHDANCDGEETLRWTRANISETANCGTLADLCAGPEGWRDPEPPGCGESGTFTYCEPSGGFVSIACTRRNEPRRQACR